MSGRGMDPDAALCFTDGIIKENLKRLNWFAKNYEKLAAENRKPREKLTKGILWEALAKRRAETAQSTVKHGIKKEKPVPLPQRQLTVNLATMKPVPPEIRDLIYQGISHEDEGTKKYLKVRYTLNPDDKFYDKDCSNWVYGWGINEVDLHKLLRIPKVQIIDQSFYRRGGVERDADHYRDAVKTEAPMFFPQL